jgi:hypothetical protein
MKRLFIAFTILMCGSTAWFALHRNTILRRHHEALLAETLKAQTLRLGQMRTQLASVTVEVRELKQRLELQPPSAASPGLDALEIPAGSAHLTPEQSERLLDHLGFSWATSSQYLMVSKDTLRAISLEGMHGTRIGDAAVQVLAITPEERAGIESTTQQLMADYAAWAQSHAQRTEPRGDVVAQYSLPADADFSLGLSNHFASAAFQELGAERGSLFLDYARSWMQDLGLGVTGGANSLKVTRYASSAEPHYSMEVKYSGNVMSTDVSPYQPFPPAFLPLFPGGWPDLAQHEGFPLPRDFQK